MNRWIIELIVGLVVAILSFIGGFFTKTLSVKINQKNRGNKNEQKINITSGEK